MSISLLLAAASLASARTLVSVAPDGPISTFEAARDEVRALRAAGEVGPIRVEFAAGIYPRVGPVTFTMADSGLPDGATTYAAAQGASVTLSGGRSITAWSVTGTGLWQAKLPDPAWRFEQLWVNGRRARLARTPNQGFFNAYTAAGNSAFAGMRKPEFEAFIARPADFATLAGIPEDERRQVLLTVMQTWTVSQCRIAELNPAAQAIRIVGHARYPFVVYEPDQRWYLENFRAALDDPGEWYLTAEGTLLYLPLPGEQLATTAFMAPVAEQLVRVSGAAEADGLVRHLTFEGITFAHTQALFGPQGHQDGQAAAGVSAAIELNHARHIRFDNCEVAHTGGYGVWFAENCADCSLTHSHLHDLGGGGVRIGVTAAPNAATLTRRIVVDDCIIRHGGRRYPSACGVFLAHASDCEITHNDISDLYYTGVSAGWVWGYKPSFSKRNRIDFNHIHHLGWGMLSDMGGFYGLGRSEGSTISHNHVHHVFSYRYGGWGLYTDEGSTGVTMENNLVHDTSESTFHQHYGKWNQISNNIFAFGRKAQIQRTRPEKHASFAYERNIVVYDSPILLDGSWYNWETGTYEIRDNLYWNSAQLPVRFLDTDLAGWQKKTGHDDGSLVADPGFADLAKRDFRLPPDSPALKLGFKLFDPRQAGVRGTGPWRKLAEQEVYPDFDKQSTPWPQPAFSMDEGFEQQSLGAPLLPRQELRVQGKGDSISVAEDRAAEGARSLKFTDAPGLKPVWDPHLVLKPKMADGAATVAFDIQAETGASLYVEWRDDSHPFRTGPAISIEGGHLIIKSTRRKIPLAAGTWSRIEMSTMLGSRASGLWTLTITPADGAPQSIADIPCDPEWRELMWLGFVSTADRAVSFWIDRLKIQRTN